MISVLFFAELRETVGSDKVSIDAIGVSLSGLKDKLKSEYKLDDLDNAMIAVNEEYAPEDAVLNEGDVVAFIPPVSGG
ncbi:molybdopterin converting factor subunit 1 [Virgibacillus doumboii]|uniref:molybdopterin converting factor subunit 1 n=1 Tax=Virgibacillus doumboii TaxID=2697503 RepID=UPI0013DF8129|nr:molybdopterin converting factor subunit 1 [Virgibacillus doumboii]